MYSISTQQGEIIQSPINQKIWLEGQAGTGKTTVGVERMLHLMSSGIPGNSILIYLPQRALATPYQNAINTPGVVAGGMPVISTLGGLAQRMIELFWPIIAEEAGFSEPYSPPIFLNHETAQFYVAHIIQPFFEKGLFNSVTISRNHIYSQVLDNLNKSALVGFPYTEIGERLTAAWSGEPGQSRVYGDTQHCASVFREYCLKHNLLDFSLQIDVFWNQLCNSQICKEYLRNSFRNLIIDNIEEDVPVSHDMLFDWLPLTDSSLLIYDKNAGYRRFLGADPIGALRLKQQCPASIEFSLSFVTSPEIHALAESLSHSIQHKPIPVSKVDPRLALCFEPHTFYPQMLDWVANQVETQIEDEGISPKDIVILVPILSDSVRFSLVNRLEQKNIPVRTHRPSRSLRDEPATNCLLTLASIAHPEWGIVPSKFDVAHSLIQAISGMDLIRAKILTEIVYRVREGVLKLSSFDHVIPGTQERISYVLGEKYDRLRLWLEEYQQSRTGELDYFISILFGEVLSQPGYGFHDSIDAGQIAAHLVDSIHNFRKEAGVYLKTDETALGKEYIDMVDEGVLAGLYLPRWQSENENAVYIAPAYTFLVNNYPVDVQFWLDIGNYTWAQRLNQPLTHPYVLSRNWDKSKTWTDIEEVETGEQVLTGLVFGLINRCRKKICLGLSEYNEQGFEQRGPLMQAYHRILQSLASV